jgi:hypothetical protein
MISNMVDTQPQGQPNNSGEVQELSTPPSAPKHRPTRSLPSNRVAFQKQLAILRGYAAASGPERSAVDLATLGQIVDMAPTTVSLMNSFFADIGLIEKTGAGYAPVLEVLNFARVHRWDPDNAGPELAPVVRATWFAEALMPRLTFGPMQEDVALAALAKEANADVDYRPKVRILLNYMEIAGLIAIEGTQVSALESPATPSHHHEAAPQPTESHVPANEPVRPHVAASGPLPLLIQGLLEQLPPDRIWTRTQARTWLRMAALAFDVVYDLGPDDGDALLSADRGYQE